MKNRTRLFGARVYVSIFVTYILLSLFLFVPFAVSSLRVRDTVYRDAKRMGDTVLQVSMERITDALVGYVRICDTLSTNPILKEYAALEGGPGAQMGMGAYRLQQSFRSLMVDGVTKLAIYFPKSQSIVANDQAYLGKGMSRFFSDYGENLSEAFLQEILSQGGYGMRVINGSDAWLTLAVESYIGNDALIIVSYNATDLLQAPSDLGLLMIGDGVTLTYSNRQEQGQETYQQVVEAVATEGKLSIGKELYLLTQQDLPYIKQQAIIGIPVSTVNNSVQQMSRWLLASMAAGLLMVIVLSLLFSHWQYEPLQRVMNLLQVDAASGSFHKVMERTRNQLESLQIENAAIQSEVAQVMPFALRKTLMRLLEIAPPRQEEISQYVLELARINNVSCYTMFGVYYLEDTTGLFRDDNNDRLKGNQLGLSFFLLNNILQDLLFQQFAGYIACVDDYYVVLAGIPDEDALKLVKEVAIHCKEFCKQHLGVELVVTTPLYGTSSQALPELFGQTMRQVAHRRFWHNQSLQEVPGAGVGPRSYFKSIRSLMNCLDNQNYQQAYQVVESILNSGCLPSGEDDLQKAIHRVYGILVTVLTAVDEQNEGLVQSLHVEDRLFGIRDVEQFKVETKKLFDELIRCRQENDEKQVPRLAREIRQYIGEHYTDPEISVSAIAAHFGISESYLTRQFKENYDSSVLEYIQRLRVEKAKELLRDYSVKAVAQTVGCWDAQALIRIFKKYEGITPGKYKELVTPQ